MYAYIIGILVHAREIGHSLGVQNTSLKIVFTAPFRQT